MTRDDIIRMAREAGAFPELSETPEKDIVFLRRFAALVAEREREACAKVCDDKHDTWRWDDEPDSASGPRDCASAIRARSNKPLDT